MKFINYGIWLVVCIIGGIGWFGLLPVLWPTVQASTTPIVLPYKSQADNILIPSDNRLLLPKIGVNATIKEGNNLDVIDREGVWHETADTNPTTPGNMVIAGHRFKFLPPNQNTLYALDKMAVGDEIIMFWEGEKYTYQIYETAVVEPTAVEIRDDHGFKELTIYTCTPLWTTKQRLVLKAKPVDNSLVN